MPPRTASTSMIPLSHLVTEGFGASVHGGPTVHHLAAQLGDDVVLDDLGRQCVSRDRARCLFTERAEQGHANAQRPKTH